MGNGIIVNGNYRKGDVTISNCYSAPFVIVLTKIAG